jgi:hypothetical protein
MQVRSLRTTKPQLLMGAGAQPQKKRDRKHIETDKAALRAIAQAAINVELFTIPLYMTTLYSIQGMHESNSKGTTYYKGRTWPGSATTAKPPKDQSINEKAFNSIFSVFIEEMLHLQLAGNLCNAILDPKTGAGPNFTSPALMTADHGWICYGEHNTELPGIVDLQDTTTYSHVKVKLDALTAEQVELFLAIEEPEETARDRIRRDKRHLYFPEAPFKTWQPQDPLPMFGSIGWMYNCYADYINLEYEGGKKLWDLVYNPKALQRDLFNVKTSGHPMPEYNAFSTEFDSTLNAAKAKLRALDMIDAITDQGEGSVVLAPPPPPVSAAQALGQAVEERYRPDPKALEVDYPSYNADGKQVPSADTVARYLNSLPDHYERFQEIQEEIKSGKIMTWTDWHKHGKKWEPAMLITSQYDPKTAPKNIPTPEEVAKALNEVRAQEGKFVEFSQISVGAIAGITSVLNDYWTNEKTAFPYPSMVGSGDRVSICWAIFGVAPDLSIGLKKPQEGTLQHACQGLDILNPDSSATCAAPETAHTCRGSNTCKAEGGCGFVQSVAGGGGCGGSGGGCGTTATATNSCIGPSCATKGDFTAPGDNKCGGFGGCAVPVSASQLFPTAGGMQLFDFVGPEYKSTPFGKPLPFRVGDSVYDTAWTAYLEVLKQRGAAKLPTKPVPSTLRVALPPST